MADIQARTFKVETLPTSDYVVGGIYFVDSENKIYVRTETGWDVYDHASEAETAAQATAIKVRTAAASDARPIPFSALGTASKTTMAPALDDNFTYNKTTQTLKVKNIEGTATEAKKVTNKLTVGNKTYDGSAAVTLTKSDLGLGNVDNTADKDKVVKEANILTGFRSRRDSNLSWGSLTKETFVTALQSENDGEIAFTESNEQLNCQIDGHFYQNEGKYKVLDESTKIKCNQIGWNGDVVYGETSPLGAACVPEFNANRLAFINPNAITIEYSRDSGTTWNNTEYTDFDKIGFCTLNDIPILLGCPKMSGNTDYRAGTTGRTRITISAQSYVYTSPKKLFIRTSGPSGLRVLIERKTGVENANWVSVIDTMLSGWSGWNDIPLVLPTLGGGKSQTGNNWYLRLTFYRKSEADYTQYIYGIKLIGDNSWVAASMVTNKGPMSATGHLYDYDTNANATFPARVTAGTLYSTGVIQSESYIYAKTNVYENGVALSQRYVQQVSGKQLSTNDYTTAEKTKLAGLSNAEALTNDEIDEAIK